MERISVEDAAARLGISASYVRRLCRSGALSAELVNEPGRPPTWMITPDDRYTARLPADQPDQQVPEVPEPTIADVLVHLERIEQPLRALAPSQEELAARAEAEAARDRRLEEIAARLDELPEVERLRGEVLRMGERNRRLLGELHEAHARIQQLEARPWWARLTRR